MSFRLTGSNISKRRISIIIPTLNEKDGLKEILNSLPQDYQIIIADGGSADGTLEIARKHKCTIFGKIKGYGKAYQVGLREAEGAVIVCLDGDGSYPVKRTPELISIFERENLDFLTTNRLDGLRKGSMSTMNYVGNKILTLFTRLLFGVKIKDSQSGMWVIRKKSLSKFMPKSDGMEFSEEIKIRAFLFARAKEIPIEYYPRMGRKKLREWVDGFKNLFHLFVLRATL